MLAKDATGTAAGVSVKCFGSVTMLAHISPCANTRCNISCGLRLLESGYDACE